MKYTNPEGHEFSIHRDSSTNELHISILRSERYDERKKSITIPSKDANELIRQIAALHKVAEFDGTFGDHDV